MPAVSQDRKALDANACAAMDPAQHGTLSPALVAGLLFEFVFINAGTGIMLLNLRR